jgi:hypothetical protein
MSVDDKVAVGVIVGNDHHDGCLLPALSQRGQQLALAARLANPQMFPPQVQLVKLQ